MSKAFELRLDRGDNLRVIMSRPDDGNPGSQIDVAIALDIPYLRIPGLVREDRSLRPNAAWRLFLAYLE